MTQKTGAQQASEQVQRQYYHNVVNHYTPKIPLVRNCVRAFLVGGTVCVIGQWVQSFFVHYFSFSPDEAGEPTVATLIAFASWLTGLGVYDTLAQWAGAGATVPVTGFANAIASAAMEHRKEGWVLGVGGHLFKVGGPVIVIGVVAAFLIGLVRVIVT